MTERAVELPPDPGREIEALRSFGYTFDTAIADLVDNSIAANADHVSITTRMDNRGNIRVSVIDDGDGMDEDALLAGMRYGSPERPHPSSLGKFGFGMKTASTSFARRLSVTTRGRDGGGVIMAYWDVDRVVREGRWVVILDDPGDESLNELTALAGNRAGTVVEWTKVERLLSRDYQDPAGHHARNRLAEMIKNLEAHLALTYYRFLNHGDRRAQNIAIDVNGKKIAAWDPFCTHLEGTDLALEETPEAEIEDQTGNVVGVPFILKAYVLPRSSEIVDPEERKQAQIKPDNQGLYVFRENRLILGPTWDKYWAKDSHSNLIRIDFSFDHRLDEAFEVDIKKSQMRMRPELRSHIFKDFAAAPRREAINRAREGSTNQIAREARSAHSESNVGISVRRDEIGNSALTVDPATGEAEVTNPAGNVRIRIAITTAANPREVHVKAVESLDNGSLWEPAVIEGHKAVLINQSHPFYQRVYFPNFGKSVTVEGIDYLLYSLIEAEYATVSEQNRNFHEDLRFYVSRVLRNLAQNLPDLPGEEADA